MVNYFKRKEREKFCSILIALKMLGSIYNPKDIVHPKHEIRGCKKNRKMKT